MNVFQKIYEGFKTAGQTMEEIVRKVEKEYEKNSTPSDSFIQEIRHLSCPKTLPSPTVKAHPLFPLTSPSVQGATDPKDPREKLMKLAFQTARERRRVEKEEGASRAIPLLIIETRIALALGDTPTADQRSALLMEKLREAAAAHALLPLQPLVESGELSAKDLEPYKAYFAIISTPDCGQKLAATPFFFKKRGPEQIEMLKDLVRLGVIAEHRMEARKALLAYDEPRRLYHEAHIALLEGNTPKSRVLLMDFKEKAAMTKDPEIVLMRAEAGEILRTFNLQEIDQLIAFNEGITEQQKGNRYGWNIREQITGESRGTSLKRMKKFLESGQADTLEEAYALGHRKGVLGRITGAIVPLFMMGTREGLERLSDPENRKKYLLETVQTINTRDGSYGIAGKMLEDVFQDELRSALVQCPKEKFEAIRADIDRDDIRKEVEQSQAVFEAALDQRLADLKEKDPQGFAQRFGEDGPTPEKHKAMIEEMITAEVDHRVTLQVGFHLLGERHDSGELKERDPLADEAWDIYNDTFDPLHEIFNVAHATGDTLKKEALFTAVTLPVGLGVGVLARSAVGGTSLVVRLAAQGGFRALAAEGMVVGVGALAEGLTGLSLNWLLKGEEITPGKVGLEFLSGLVGGGAGRLWKRASKALKINEEALEELVKKGGSRAEIAGRKIGGFAGPLSLSVANSTLFGEIGILFEDEPVKTSFAERLAGNFLKAMIDPQLEKAVHFLTGNKLEHMDEHVWKRLKIAREEFLVLQRTDPSPNPALFEMGQAASSLKSAGWTEKEIMEFLELDPSLAPLVMPAEDNVDDLVKNLPGFKAKDPYRW